MPRPTTTHRVLFLTAALTGLRLGELLALRWAAVDYVAERIHVEAAYCQTAQAEKTPKSGKVRSVPMATEVAQALAKLQTTSEFNTDADLVFPGWDGDHLPYAELRVAFLAAIRAAKLPPLRFHDLRHTFGTMCASSGIPLTTVQTYMGHAHISTTMIYAHFAPAGNEAALISRAFSGSGAGATLVPVAA